jgi:large subunit ribosomal protein L23
MTAQDIIIKPILTEKSYGGIAGKVYTFIVSKKANKTQIKLAVEELFPEAKVEKVNTANYEGKLKRQGKTEGRRPSYKKAVVTLKDNSKPIAFFESLS